MASEQPRPAEVFSAPIESVIAALGKSIGAAQAALDRSSIATQDALDADPVMSGLGLQATWYQLPRVDLELKLSMTMSEETEPTAREARVALLQLTRPVNLIAQ